MCTLQLILISREAVRVQDFGGTNDRLQHSQAYMVGRFFQHRINGCLHQ